MEFEFKFGQLTTLFLGALVLAWPVFAIVQSSRSNGEADYCYVEQHSEGALPYYTLYTHRPWRPDVVKMSARTFEEAVSAAKTLNCSLEKK